MVLGITIGFLVKHELDTKHKEKRIEQRLKSFASTDISSYDQTLRDVRELNRNLVVFQKKKEAK